jgi:hypothetical protein
VADRPDRPDRPEREERDEREGSPAGGGARRAAGRIADHEPMGTGHTGSGGVDDRAVPWRVFVGIGGFILLMAAVYWATSDEEAGIVLLALSAVLAGWSATYLWLQLHRQPRTTAEAPTPEPEAAAYLPHASVWPFAIGLGAATALNGLVLGIWVLLPGAALMLLGVGGFVVQTRRRD